MKKNFVVCAVVTAAVLGISAFAGIGAASAQTQPDNTPPTSSAETVISHNGLPGLLEKGLQLKQSAQSIAILEKASRAGRIDPADYELVHDQYVRCMDDRGYHADFRKTKFGTYMELPYLHVTDGGALDAAMISCSRESGAVTAIYDVQQSNPQLLKDSRAVAVQCLVDGGYVPTGYTKEQLESDFRRDTFPFDADATGPNDCLFAGGISYFTVN